MDAAGFAKERRLPQVGLVYLLALRLFYWQHIV